MNNTFYSNNSSAQTPGDDAKSAGGGLARKLEPFGITLGREQIDLAYVIEEVGELGIPLMFAVAIYLTYRLPRIAAAAPSTAP